jgi:hypothetical protein
MAEPQRILARVFREIEVEPRMLASEAHRLKEDPALTSLLNHIEGMATHQAIQSPDLADRERGRVLALAVRVLREEIENRIETVKIMEYNRQRAMASE